MTQQPVKVDPLKQEIMIRNAPTQVTFLPPKDEWDRLKELCQITIASRLIPQKSWQEAFVVALKGRELGIPPMYSWSHIAVIAGKPAPSSELQLALILRKFPQAKIEYPETSDEVCRIRVVRPPSQVSEEWVFTMEDAKKAGLHLKDSWKKYPAAMLRARCISLMARAKFPDALMGMSHTAEELGAEVNEEGESVGKTDTTSGRTPSILEHVVETTSAPTFEDQTPPEDIVIGNPFEQEEPPPPSDSDYRPAEDERPKQRDFITEKQQKLFYALTMKLGWNNQRRCEYLLSRGIKNGDSNYLPFQVFDTIVQELRNAINQLPSA